MTPAQYRALRERMKLTQGELAKKLGVALNTISRRELGQLEISREAELAIRFIARQRFP